MSNLMREFHILFFCLATAFILSHGEASETGLLKNADFEVPWKNGIAKHWNDNSSWANVDVSYDIVNGHKAGTQAQQIRCTRYLSGAVQFIQRGISVEKGRSYKLSFYSKSESGPIAFSVVIRSLKKPYSQYFSCSFRATEAWEVQSCTVIAEGTDEDALIMFRITHTGTLVIDDVSFNQLAAAKIENNNTFKDRKNLLANSSFEVGLDKWGFKFKRDSSFVEKLPAGGNEYVAHNKSDQDVSKGRAKHGNHSLKIELFQGSMCWITSSYVRTQPGRTYTLSAWFRGSRNVKASLHVAAGYLGTSDSSEVVMESLSTSWNRISVSFTAKNVPGQAYYPAVRLYGSGLCYVDAVQLNIGEAPITYETKERIAVGINIKQPLPYIGEDVGVEILSWSEIPTTADLEIRLVDYNGATIDTENMLAELEPKKTHSFIYRPLTQKAGYYKIIVKATSSEGLSGTTEKAFAVVPLRQIRGFNSPFGAHSDMSPESLERAKRIGVSWLRLHASTSLTKWYFIEPIKGKFNFYDEPIKLARNMGFYILGMLDMSPKWGSSVPDDYKERWLFGTPAYMPTNIDDWREYVRTIVARYTGFIDHWEVWNEPDSNFFKVLPHIKKPNAYVTLLRSAYKETKLANPNVRILAPCASANPITSWTRDVLDEGAYKYFDIFSYHRYTDGLPGDEAEPTTTSLIENVNKLLDKYGGQKPIWDTEGGLLMPASAYNHIVEVSNEYATPPKEATKYFVRNMCHLLSASVKKWFYFTVDVSHRIDERRRMSVFEWDGSPRPLAAAYAVMASLLSDAAYKGVDHPAGDLVAHNFDGPIGTIRIVWSTKGQVRMSLPAGVATQVLDIVGSPIEPESANNKQFVSVGSEPKYFLIGRHGDVNPPGNFRISEFKALQAKKSINSRSHFEVNQTMNRTNQYLFSID